MSHLEILEDEAELSDACRPHFVVFPEDEAGFAIDDQFFVGGSGLLVKPVTEKGVTEAQVYLSEDQVRHLPYNPTSPI